MSISVSRCFFNASLFFIHVLIMSMFSETEQHQRVPLVHSTGQSLALSQFTHIYSNRQDLMLNTAMRPTNIKNNEDINIVRIFQQFPKLKFLQLQVTKYGAINDCVHSTGSQCPMCLMFSAQAS